MRALAAALTLVLCAGLPAAAQSLSEADRKELEGVLARTLYDPSPAARRCRLKLKVRTVWGEEGLVEREGWAVAEAGQPTRVLLADGWQVRDPVEVVPFDFAGGCRALIAALQANQEPPPEASREHPLALAAWALRGGDQALAATFLDLARQEQAALKERAPEGQGEALALDAILRGHLTWQAYSSLVHAYMFRADAEAEAWGAHLMAKYGEEVRGTQAAAIMAELARRKAAGSFGRAPDLQRVRRLSSLELAERIPALIASLDEVDARQEAQPGGVDLGSDTRVRALIGCGDAAVPALLDVLEKDRRLTRSVHFWRDFGRDRTVLGVAEAALVALQSILRIQLFEPRSTGDNFTIRGPEAAALAAQRLRTYWDANGALSLPERLRRTLVAEEAASVEWRQAARELARLDRERRIGTTLGANTVSEARLANPARRLANPTAAEAILAAMDRDVKRHLATSAESDPRGDALRELEALYVDALVELGDERVAPRLAERAAAATRPSLRRILSVACRGLGLAEPLDAWARDFAAGKQSLGVFQGADLQIEETPGGVELDACVQTFTQLSAGGVASCDSALFALGAPSHPLHEEALELLWLRAGPEGGLWVQHPWHLRLLAGELTRTEETGRVYRLEEIPLMQRQEGGPTWLVIVEEGGQVLARQPLSLGAEREEREARVSERRCDRAATALSVRLLGTPTYDLLAKDRAARLAALRDFCARHLAGVQRASAPEVAALRLGSSPFEVLFRPSFAAAGRKASPADVASGAALFTLEGGEPLALVLPALARLKETGQPVLILQAEAGAGQARFAALSEGALRVLGPEAVTEPRGIPAPGDQRIAAQTLVGHLAAGRDAQAAELLAEGFRGALAREKSTQVFFDQLRQALGQAGPERLTEMLAPGFSPQDDGVLRWEPR